MSFTRIIFLCGLILICQSGGANAAPSLCAEAFAARDFHYGDFQQEVVDELARVLRMGEGIPSVSRIDGQFLTRRVDRIRISDDVFSVVTVQGAGPEISLPERVTQAVHLGSIGQIKVWKKNLILETRGFANLVFRSNVIESDGFDIKSISTERGWDRRLRRFGYRSAFSLVSSAASLVLFGDPKIGPSLARGAAWAMDKNDCLPEQCRDYLDKMDGRAVSTPTSFLELIFLTEGERARAGLLILEAIEKYRLRQVKGAT